ncbi:uncharacterized protein LOC131009626 [Salvia miltiorrhiza]|uniref:uncharacterized protein LOC131009626 n=1 Tax=Salvia miltiorrhiza TaxID=226208 RepID=UPI0025AC4BA6|nr:uncharacterized protein LOC131009626 [Salvia miltiorrhiza]
MELFDRELGMTNALLEFISVCTPNAGKMDVWRWKKTKSGELSTKSVYEVLMQNRNLTAPVLHSNAMMAKVWSAPTPHKVRVTAWRCLKNRLATYGNLVKRRVQLADVEVWCNACVGNVETANHLFLLCPKAQQVWNAIESWMGIRTARPKELMQHFNMFINSGRGRESEKALKALWMCTIWLLWKQRNESRFEEQVWEVQRAVSEIKGTSGTFCFYG